MNLSNSKAKIPRIYFIPKGEGWFVGEFKLNSKLYTILTHLLDKPNEKTLNGGRILRLEIITSDLPIAMYHLRWNIKPKNIDNSIITAKIIKILEHGTI
jgi:hypothetical protein